MQRQTKNGSARLCAVHNVHKVRRPTSQREGVRAYASLRREMDDGSVLMMKLVMQIFLLLSWFWRTIKIIILPKYHNEKMCHLLTFTT